MARSFSGSTANAIISSGGAVSTGPPITVACWVYMSTAAQGSDFFNFGLGGGGQYRMGTSFHGGVGNTLRTDIRDGSGDSIVDPAITLLPVNGTWFHVAAAFTTTTQTGWVFGGNKFSGTNTSQNNTTSGASVGCLALSTSDFGNNNLNGGVAECGVWNVVLSDFEVSALARGARCRDIRPSSLLIYLPLDGIESTEPNLAFLGNASGGVIHGSAPAVFGPPLMMFTPRRPITAPAPPPDPMLMQPLLFV